MHNNSTLTQAKGYGDAATLENKASREFCVKQSIESADSRVRFAVADIVHNSASHNEAASGKKKFKFGETR